MQQSLTVLWVLFGAAVGVAVACTAFHHFVVRSPALRARLLRWRSSAAHANRRLHRALRATRRAPGELKGLEGGEAGGKAAAADHELDGSEGSGDEGGRHGGVAIRVAPAPDAAELQQLVRELQQQQAALGRLVERVGAAAAAD